MIGNGFGYSTHQRMLRAALERHGVIMSDDSNVAVHIIVPTGFQPVEGKFNILFTMYECNTLPDEWVPYVQQPDLIVVPCSHNRRLFQRYTDVPVEVCLEGVDTELFSYEPRQFPTDRPFVFLWNGASNPRKGYEHVALAWASWNRRHPELEKKATLIMKTTQVTREERLIGMRNAFVDTRKYSIENLVTLYHFAHCFLFPTMGEGFGLTLAEAMSTGLPCIYTPWSGPADFVSEREAFPLQFTMKKVRTMKIMPDGSQQKYHTTVSASANIEHLVRRMEQVYFAYDLALARGRRAAERIRREITWDISARRFIDIVEQYTSERLEAVA